MSTSIASNGTWRSTEQCPHEECHKPGQHWHQEFDDHSVWRLGTGCPTHLHRYEPKDADVVLVGA